MTRAFVFPGQGSQAVGMGRELAAAFPAARHLFQEVDDALSQHLAQLMFEGPGEELTLTENAQPALMAVSLAVIRVLGQEGGMDVAKACAFVAGHSLGEYSALAAAEALSVPAAASLLKTRGRAMQQAVPVGVGGMAALIGVDFEAAQAIAKEASEVGVCETANDNAPGQVVVSGTLAAVERAVAIAGGKGARKCVMLPVSAPFHCSLLAPAAEVMQEALEGADVKSPVVPLIANVTAEPVQDAAEIRRLLVKQVTSTVRWRESVLAMKALGVDTLVEVGVGKVLSGLTRRIDRDLAAMAVGTPEDIEALVKTL
ncbi:MAG: ACP S-malonyltransferase [Rhodospirillales bacterium]|nr:ACP S-malonyltransferase [Rhodospirillales bacterium]